VLSTLIIGQVARLAPVLHALDLSNTPGPPLVVRQLVVGVLGLKVLCRLKDDLRTVNILELLYFSLARSGAHTGLGLFRWRLPLSTGPLP